MGCCGGTKASAVARQERRQLRVLVNYSKTPKTLRGAATGYTYGMRCDGDKVSVFPEDLQASSHRYVTVEEYEKMKTA